MARDHRDGVLVVGDDVVHVRLEASVGGLRQLGEVHQDLVATMAIAGEASGARAVPCDILGQDPPEIIDISCVEGLIALPEESRVRMLDDRRSHQPHLYSSPPLGASPVTMALCRWEGQQAPLIGLKTAPLRTRFRR